MRHKLKRATREILGLLRNNPKNTPTFDIIAGHGVGIMGKKIDQIIIDNGYNSGGMYYWAFYNLLDRVAQDPNVAVIIERQNHHRKMKVGSYSHDELIASTNSPLTKALRVKIVPQNG
jgi:hypothetical protein